QGDQPVQPGYYARAVIPADFIPVENPDAPVAALIPTGGAEPEAHRDALRIPLAQLRDDDGSAHVFFDHGGGFLVACEDIHGDRPVTVRAAEPAVAGRQDGD